MKIRRTIPPAAAPISFLDLLHGFRGMGKRETVAKREEEMREYFGKRHVFLVSSGKAAMFMIFTALKDLTGKKRVIIPAYTCYSVPSAIRMAELDVVLCDMRQDTLDFDFPELRKLIDDDTLCIVPTHLFGVPADVGKIREICVKRKIFIVEDAAQAMGVVHGNKMLGTLGDVSFFSLGRGKNITCGTGGVVITSSDDIAEAVRRRYAKMRRTPVLEDVKIILEILFQAIFLHPNLYWFPKGLPFLGIGETRFYSSFPVYRLSGFQAGLLRNWRDKLAEFNRKRASNAAHYLECLCITEQMPIYANGHPYLRFPLYLGSKEEKDEACKNGSSLGISPLYPESVNNIREIKEDYIGLHYGNAQEIADTLVTLPTHILLKEKDKEMISGRIRKYQTAARKDRGSMQ